jgi:hypothetical protein
VLNCKGCNDASGVLQIKASMLLRHALCLGRNDTMTLTQPKIAVGLGWDPLWGEVAIDLDASCVCVDGRGEILMGECVTCLLLYCAYCAYGCDGRDCYARSRWGVVSASPSSVLTMQRCCVLTMFRCSVLTM